MPTYEYACSNCGYTFEKFQSITKSPLRKCTSCGKMSLKRLIGSGAGVIFKGSGFYQTDYRSESYKQEAKKATENKAAPSESKTPKETKPKAETKNQTKAAG